MRRGIMLTAMFLPLAGCVAPGYGYGSAQSGYGQPEYPLSGYGQPEYRQSGYGQPEYPRSGYGQPEYPRSGYGQPEYPQSDYGQPIDPGTGYADEAEAYPGYSYNEGSPTLMVEGAALPLIFFGGAWGYHDGYRQFHRAPDRVWRHLETQHPRGNGLRPYSDAAPASRFGGAQQARPEWRDRVQPGGFSPQPRTEFRQPSGGAGFGGPGPHGAVPVQAAQPQPQPQPRQHQGGDHRCPHDQPRC